MIYAENLQIETPVLKFKKLNETATTPTCGSLEAAGLDLYANFESEKISIPPHKTILVGTGIAVEIPSGYYGGIFARSGLATKQGLRPANCVGVVDTDYTGEIKVALHNDTDETKKIDNNERIAQLIICPYLTVNLLEVEELRKTERGEGGFGSTGKH